jgi:hypothetical protein
MKLLILLDFDGVLFNSAYEAYKVCEAMVPVTDNHRADVSFEEFMDFRSHLTDAWQFNRLYDKKKLIKDYAKLIEIEPDEQDWRFAKNFFAARADMMKHPDWAKIMSPYDFFFQIRNIIQQHPNNFKILSTRNQESIKRTLDYFLIPEIEIFGQEKIRECGSKFNVAMSQGWISNDYYTIYVDDMNSHLEPFEHKADVCFHAGWGYDQTGYESVTSTQLAKIIRSLVCLDSGKKFTK